MCLQCVVEAEALIEDVVPGFSLMISTNDQDEEWPRGHYGLVKINDPELVWKLRPVEDPFWGMTEEEETQLEKCDKVEYDRRGNVFWEEFMPAVHNLRDNFFVDPLTGYEFICACMLEGYEPRLSADIETHLETSPDVITWFVHHAAIKLKRVEET